MLRDIRYLLLLPLLSLRFCALNGQDAVVPLHLEESAVRQQLLKSDPPVYPAIAQAARIQGDVVVEILINRGGAVSSEKIISGPPMLRQAATDAIKQWTFAPFEINGKAVQVASRLTVSFSLAKLANEPNESQQKAAQALFPLADKCRNALRQNDAASAVDLCSQAVDLSYKAGDLTSSDQLMMTEMHQLYGHALLEAGRFFEALNEEDKAIDEAKVCLTEKDQEYAMPFYWRAMVEVRLDENDKALSDLDIAEQTHRRAIANLPDMKKIYGNYLAGILKQHAALLEKLGRTDEASKLKAEAATL